MTRERDDIIRLGKCFITVHYEHFFSCFLEEQQCVRLGTFGSASVI